MPLELRQQIKFAQMKVVNVLHNLKRANISILVDHNIRPHCLKISAMKLTLKRFIPAPNGSDILTECLFLDRVTEIAV